MNNVYLWVPVFPKGDPKLPGDALPIVVFIAVVQIFC